jgi:RNA polymerase sigma factor (sigma-70 family)
MSKPTVFVIDDDDALRESLRSLVASAGLNVEAFASPQRFLECYRPDGPACLVLDVRLPEMSGIELQETLAERGITVPIIITGYGDVPTAVRAMKRGAADFFEKPFDPQALLDRIQQCLERDAETRRNDALRDQIRARLSNLTPREQEVMDMIVAGHTNKGIAEHLGISPRTVEIHRASLMQKMKTRSVVELVKASLIGQFPKVRP